MNTQNNAESNLVSLLIHEQYWKAPQLFPEYLHHLCRVDSEITKLMLKQLLLDLNYGTVVCVVALYSLLCNGLLYLMT